MRDRDLLSEIQYAVIEPPDGGDTWPSLIWTRDEVLDSLNQACRALARDTHVLVNRLDLPVAAGTLSIPLPADWLATAYLVWRDAATSVRTPLGPVDSFEGDLAAPGWETTPGLPLGYVDLDGPTLTIRLLPTPAADGVVELLYIQVPPLVTATAPGADLPLVEEVTSGLKYATLGMLLRKVGRLLDVERANYCERRAQLTTTATAIILGGWS